MNEITLLREAGPEGPALTNATRNTARAALLAEIDGASRPHRIRLPSRKARWRVGAGVIAVAAAWTAAVVIAAPDELGPLPDSVTLVAFEPPVFPLSLDPLPAGWDVSFSADPGGILHAAYGDTTVDASGNAEGDGLYLRVSPDEPEQYDVTDTDDVSVDGQDAEFVRGDVVMCGGTETECVEERVPYLHLVWERHDDQWVQLEGYGAYDDADQLLEVAQDLVDRPQAVPLRVSLAPAGWSVYAYKDDRILTLVDDNHEQHTLTVHLPLPEDVLPADQVRQSIASPIGPQVEETVNGRPAQLVRVQSDLLVEGRFLEGWYLQAQLPDGTTFVVQAPGSFTQEQVLQLAESVTYNP
jgi:hypothetical protein